MEQSNPEEFLMLVLSITVVCSIAYLTYDLLVRLSGEDEDE